MNSFISVSRKRKAPLDDNNKVETGEDSTSSNNNDDNDDQQPTSRQHKRRRVDDEQDDGSSSSSFRGPANDIFQMARQIFDNSVGNLIFSGSEWTAKQCCKVFLLAVELASRREAATRDVLLEDEKEIVSALVHILDAFQAHDSELRLRVWRALSYFVVDRPAQFPSATLSADGRRVKRQQSPSLSLTLPQLPARKDSMEEEFAVILTVMQHAEHDEQVQTLGFRAIKTIISTTGENWQALYRAGAFPVLLAAMRNSPENKILQALATSYLTILMKDVGDPVRVLMVQQGAVALILRFMRRFDNDFGSVHLGILAIFQMSISTFSKQNLLRHNVFGTLSHIARSCSHKEKVIESTLESINHLSMSMGPGRNALAGHDMVALALSIVQEHPNKQNVVFNGLVLVRSAGRHEAIPHLPTIPIAIDAMKRFPDAGGILFFAGAVMWQILTNADNEDNRLNNNGHEIARERHALIASLGGIECITTAVLNHRQVFGLPPVAHLILNHAWDCRPREEADQAATAAFGGSERVVSLITRLENNDEDGDDNNGDVNGHENND